MLFSEMTNFIVGVITFFFLIIFRPMRSTAGCKVLKRKYLKEENIYLYFSSNILSSFKLPFERLSYVAGKNVLNKQNIQL